MLRTFQTHHLRPTASMDTWWDFVTAPERTGKGALPKTYTRSLYVPGVWESVPGLENYRGKAWYRTFVEMHPDLALRIVFGGVSHTGTVYVDGREVGRHYDAFTPWDVRVPYTGRDMVELVVEVDNSFGPHSALHIPNDYYTYGGITRPVEMQYVPAVYVDKLFATPVRKGKAWSLEVKVRLRNLADTTETRELEVWLEGACLRPGAVTLKPGGTCEVEGVLRKLDVEAWSPESPELYDVEAVLLEDGRPVDDLIDRVGFREVKVRGRKILVNGKPVFFTGFNRHEDHPHHGCAIPLEAMVHDLRLMRDLNANMVRTCHYPNDMRFLDLCDEMGMFVWEESHARTVSFNEPKYREQVDASTDEMLDWHFNHPSIVIWGCLNECDTMTPEGVREHARVQDRIRARDRSRPVTFAANHRDKDLAQGTCDVTCWNIYTGWYADPPEATDTVIRKLLRWLHSPASKGGNGHPVILSEFGAGGIYGHRSPKADHWTEEFQTRVLRENLKAYCNNKDICGALIWQFCDVRVTEEGYGKKWAWWAERPRTMNNKGVVDEYRRPKMCYTIVREIFGEVLARFR